jgi:16S rRNA (guanine1207-N2)-methyltransferase
LSSLDFSTLRRWPDIEAENLFAFDASDRLILDLAAPLLDGARVAVIGDNYGALTAGALSLGAHDVRVYQDDLVGELALAANAPGGSYSNHSLGAELLAGATLVLIQLPRGLDELDEQLEAP